MATRGEMHRYFEERSGAKKKPRVKRDWPGAAHLPGVHPSDDRLRHGATASRNWSAHAAREAPYVLEDSPSGKPSKRSTRKGTNRIKRQKRVTAFPVPGGGARTH